MADDQNQRPYRSNEPPARRAPAAASAAGSDPLAELARLIGQTDPFAEFGRDNARRAAAPPAAAGPPPAARVSAPTTISARTTAPPPRRAGRRRRRLRAAGPARASLTPPAISIRPRAEAPGHPAADAGGYEPAPYHPSNAQFDGEDEDYLRGCPAAEPAHGHHGHRRRVCAGGDRHRRRLRLSRDVRPSRSSARRPSSRPTPRRARSCRRPPARRPTS